MNIEMKDIIIIDYADKIRRCRLANGLDNIIFNDEGKIKVIFEGDNSHNSITINKKDIITVIKGIK